MRTWSGKHRCWAQKGLCLEHEREKKRTLSKGGRAGASGANRVAGYPGLPAKPLERDWLFLGAVLFCPPPATHF